MGQYFLDKQYAQRLNEWLWEIKRTSNGQRHTVTSMLRFDGGSGAVVMLAFHAGKFRIVELV